MFQIIVTEKSENHHQDNQSGYHGPYNTLSRPLRRYYRASNVIGAVLQRTLKNYAL